MVIEGQDIFLLSRLIIKIPKTFQDSVICLQKEPISQSTKFKKLRNSTGCHKFICKYGHPENGKNKRIGFNI